MPELHLVSVRTDGREGGGDATLTLTRFPCVVGRHSACDHRLDDPRVSRRHCAFSLREGRVWVEDLGSRNGTRLNGADVRAAQPLGEGDRLELAQLPFQVRLHGAAAEAAVGQGAVVGEAGPGARPRQVLVVEDDPDTAQVLALLLRAWGHRVAVAPDGPQALQAAQEEPPDTVLLDIRLPGMDGYEVARRLRSEAGLGQAKLVAVTGDEREKDPGRSHAGGFQHLLVKPVDPEALRQVLGPPT
jgi:CheY-like chemotaxis protein